MCVCVCVLYLYRRNINNIQHTDSHRTVGHLHIHKGIIQMETQISSYSNGSVSVSCGHKHNPFFPVLQILIHP